MRRTFRDDKGDAVMVTATLLLSIALAVGGRLLLDYGEIQGKELDMEHSNDVEDSMVRSRAAMLALLTREDTVTTLMTRITLGTPGNPYLAVARSSGSLDYDPTPSQFQMQIVVKNLGAERIVNTINGVLTFRSNNYYYHDQQFTFQAGAVLLNEFGPSVISTPLSMDYYTDSVGWSVNLNLYGFTGERWSLSGIESIPLKISLESYSTISFDPGLNDIVTLRINTLGEEAWRDHLRNHFRDLGLIENTDFRLVLPADYTDPAQVLDIELLTPNTVSFITGEMEVTL